MLTNVQKRILPREEGFTLIELLVVILIIGILAAIALPSFLNQREKAQDAEAKSMARTAQTAAETYYTDKQSYTGLTAGELRQLEPSLAQANNLYATGSGNWYYVHVNSKSTDTGYFGVFKNYPGWSGGSFTGRSCTTGGTGACKAASGGGNDWGGTW